MNAGQVRWSLRTPVYARDCGEESPGSEGQGQWLSATVPPLAGAAGLWRNRESATEKIPPVCRGQVSTFNISLLLMLNVET